MNENQSKSKIGILKDYLIYGIGILGSKSLSFLLLPFYTNVLTTEEYGLIDIIVTTAALLTPICSLSLDEAIFRFCMSQNHEKEKVISTCMNTYLAATVSTALILFTVNQFITSKYMLSIFLLLVLGGLNNIVNGMVKGLLNIRIYSYLGVIQTALILAQNIFFIKYLQLGVWGYVLAYTTAYMITSMIGCAAISIWKYYKAEIDKTLFLEIGAFAVPLIPSAISWWIMMSSDRYMIAFFCGISATGIYSLANKIPTILNTAFMAFKSVWQIRANRLYEQDQNELRKTVETYIECNQALGYIGGSFIILFSPFLMSLIAQKDFYDGWIFVPALTIAVVCISVSSIITVLYSTFKKNAGSFYSAMLGAVINVILNVILIPSMGMQGAAIATAVSYVAVTIYKLIDTQKFLKYQHFMMRFIWNTIVISFQAVTKIYQIEYPIQNQVVVQLFLIGAIVFINRNGVAKILHAIIHSRNQLKEC